MAGRAGVVPRAGLPGTWPSPADCLAARPRAAIVQLPHHLLSAVTPSALGCCRGCVDVVLMCCFLPRREKNTFFDGSKF